jgi:hypothetical protein
MAKIILGLILALFVFGALGSIFKGLIVGMVGYGIVLLAFCIGVWMVYKNIKSKKATP